MKRKLVLVNPVRIGLTVNESSRFPPIGLGIVAALTPDHAAVIASAAKQSPVPGTDPAGTWRWWTRIGSPFAGHSNVNYRNVARR